MHRRRLIERLKAIAAALEADDGLALIGLGSSGRDLDRLDQYSDLDFFAIVRDGQKQNRLNDLGWLAAAAPIAYSFRNTPDGHKLLFADGIFCEFAVFEMGELGAIPFGEGRIVWKRPEVPDDICMPKLRPAGRPRHDADWLIGEALTNLYVGIARDKRGEKLSGMRFIQGYAVDRLMELAELMPHGEDGNVKADPFAPDRRFENRYPDLALRLPGCLRGYDHNASSALTILAILEEHFPVNAAMAEEIRSLCRH